MLALLLIFGLGPASVKSFTCAPLNATDQFCRVQMSKPVKAERLLKATLKSGRTIPLRLLKGSNSVGFPIPKTDSLTAVK